MKEILEAPPVPPQKSSRPGLRFSLKSLLFAMAIVAAFLGGRASMRPNWMAPPSGTWRMSMPRGHQREITLTHHRDGRLGLSHGGVLSGQYRWTAGQLQMDDPVDRRYGNLVWEWDGDELVLVAEPAGQPSGSSYGGTRLRFLTPETSAFTTEASPEGVHPRIEATGVPGNEGVSPKFDTAQSTGSR